MASSTANLGLVLPFQSEAVSVTTQNDNLTKIDNAVNGLQDGMAILANGNTHAAIASGQYVYVRNHSSLAEGLYKATTAIATNGTLSTSNLTADSSGGLNDLQNQITTLNSKFTSDYPVKSKASTHGTHSSFTVENVTSNDAYLLFGASGAVAPFCYLISVASGQVVVNRIVDPYGITVTGTISNNNTLTISFSPSVTTIIKCIGLR